MATEWLQCPNGCGAKLYYREVQMHVQTICSERKEHCSMGCGQLVKFRERQKHKMMFCDCRIVNCKHAPACKWTGMAKDLAIHTSNAMSLREKKRLVPGDMHIECLERPWQCWHPPLVAPALSPLFEEGGYQLRWSGCGMEIRFGDRSKHEANACHFRTVGCPNGCGKTILGYRLQEHLEGKDPRECISVSAWASSGCPLRDVYCRYVLGKKKKPVANVSGDDKKHGKNKDKEGRGRTVTRNREDNRKDAAHVKGAHGAAKEGDGGQLKDAQGLEQGEEAAQAQGEDAQTEAPKKRKVSLISMYEPAERAKERAELAKWDVQIEEGCSEKLRAKDLVEHQKAECTERFLLCKHGCGSYIKFRLQFEHEDQTHQLQTDLHLAAEDGNLERVKDHVEGRDGARKFPIGCRDEVGENALHYAIRNKHHEVVKYLLANKCDPNVKGAYGKTPVMITAAKGDGHGLDLLLRANAQVTPTDDLHGWTALHYSVFNCNLHVTQVLIKARADIDVKDNRRRDTPLHMALIGGREEIAELLASAGADKDAPNNRKVNVYYHTFDRSTGKPKEIRRGDVPFDLARSDYMRAQVLPHLVQDIANIAISEGIDPRFGNTFATAKGHRQVSPAKERALGRSPSPKKHVSSSPTRHRRDSDAADESGGELAEGEESHEQDASMAPLT